MYIAYTSVSKPTPWAVAGPHEQLASTRLYVGWPRQVNDFRKGCVNICFLPISGPVGSIIYADLFGNRFWSNMGNRLSAKLNRYATPGTNQQLTFSEKKKHIFATYF